MNNQQLQLNCRNQLPIVLVDLNLDLNLISPDTLCGLVTASIQHSVTSTRSSVGTHSLFLDSAPIFLLADKSSTRIDVSDDVNDAAPDRSHQR